MKKDTSYELKKEEEAVSPVIATILMVAITVVLAGVLYVWASELAGNQADFGTFNNYVAEDIKPTTSAAVNDPLLRMRFSNGPDDLSWSFLKVSLSGEDGTLSECKVGQVSALGDEVNVFNLISDNNAHDLSSDADRNGELPNGDVANFASRLPNNAGYFATAYATNPPGGAGLATGEAYFLSYDFDAMNTGSVDGAGNAPTDLYTYYLYEVVPNEDSARNGHEFELVTSFTSYEQYAYFANQYVADYVRQVPGDEVLITGNFGDDEDNTEYTLMAINLQSGNLIPIAETGDSHTQAAYALDTLVYFFQSDGQSLLMALGDDNALWSGTAAIQKNNMMIGTPNSLTFMSTDGVVSFVLNQEGEINEHSQYFPPISGYLIGYTSDFNWMIIGSDAAPGGAAGGFTMVYIGSDYGMHGSIWTANTAGYAVYGTYATVLNTQAGNTVLYYNAMNLATGSIDVMAYTVAGVDADDDDVDDGSAEAQGFETRSGITMEEDSVNFGAYSGVVGVFRQGTNTDGTPVFQLIIMEPESGINLAFWSDQVGLLSNLAAVLGADYEDPNFNQGFYTQYVHDLGLGTGKVMTTYVDDNSNMDPGLIDLVAMVQSLNSGDAAGEATTDAKCIIFQEESTDDGLWQGTEVLTIYENGADICGPQITTTCELEVTVYYQGKILAGTGTVDVL